MHQTLYNKVIEWNLLWNGLPRKALLILLTFVFTAILFLVFPYCWPFLLALLFSQILEPLVTFVTDRFIKIKKGRIIATVIGMLLLFGIVGVLTFAIVNRLVVELVSLSKNIPTAITWMTDVAFPYVRDLYGEYQTVLPTYVMDILNNTLSTLAKSAVTFAGTLSAIVTSGAFSTALSIPNVLLSIVLTMMGTFYMTADRTRIIEAFRVVFPKHVRRQSSLIKTNLLRALFGQIKSQLTLSLIILAFLIISFSIYGMRYGLIFAIVIGLADALPVIGAGLFFIPWSICGFIFGDISIGIFMACMYIGTIIIRQIFEPRIVGKNLGLYPLATMIAMYAGYRAFGVFGLLAGPVLLNILKVVLEADATAQEKLRTIDRKTTK